MRRNLFWLNDEQWKRMEPHLPTDVRARHYVALATHCPITSITEDTAAEPGPFARRLYHQISL